jgi:antitoxin PrlF
MIDTMIVDSAKVMSKGQITLPVDIRRKLGLSTGDKVTFVCQDDKVVLMNSALYAMRILQENMKDEAEKVGIKSEKDINALVAEVRLS